MKRAILIILLIITGLGIFFYPYVSNWLIEKNASYIIETYDQAVEASGNQEIEKEWKKAKEYNDSLEGTVLKDPFIEGSGMALQDNYKELLNIDGIMGYVEIPAIDVKLSIFHGTSDATLQKGIGHLEGSSLPIGGSGTHAILTGHTGLSKAKFFTDLVELKEGDRFYLRILDKTLAYLVDQIKVVEPENTKDLQSISGKDYVTLLTCTPYGVNSHRLLVRGVRTEYHPEEKTEVQDIKKTLTKEQRMLILTAVTSLVTVLLLICIVWVVRRKRRQKR
ncbi:MULTISPECIES: class C sortase [Blautia]|uniref:Sortase A n=1 Tax=Blautia producta TaxID=33035 RepID=A0ABZ0U7U6_9FIRM|nr:class C sortase [Blautia coccoides]TCO54507.1 sortase A [Blautia coccoides]WPX72304.1 hypothetical protein BLCOC_06400 [Blautia coccoides]SUY05686.1 sortase [Blautia coccoides]